MWWGWIFVGLLALVAIIDFVDDMYDTAASVVQSFWE